MDSELLRHLVRNVTSLQTVSYATVPRYVSTPVNFSKAQTTGLEFEIKGRALNGSQQG